jgi:hypothetical protein
MCPATLHGGAWKEKTYSSYSFLTSALDEGEWSESRPGRALPPKKGPLVPTGQESRWVPWMQRLEEKSFAPAEDRTPLVFTCIRSQKKFMNLQTKSMNFILSMWLIKERENTVKNNKT